MFSPSTRACSRPLIDDGRLRLRLAGLAGVGVLDPASSRVAVRGLEEPVPVMNSR